MPLSCGQRKSGGERERRQDPTQPESFVFRLQTNGRGEVQIFLMVHG